MKAETADYLAKASVTLADAEKIAARPLPHVAAREAYLAVFHAAEALTDPLISTTVEYLALCDDFGEAGDQRRQSVFWHAVRRACSLGGTASVCDFSWCWT